MLTRQLCRRAACYIKAPSRRYATSRIFDEAFKAVQYQKAYAKGDNDNVFMLHKEIAERLVDRLDDLSTKEFKRVLLHGAHSHLMIPFLDGIPIGKLDQADVIHQTDVDVPNTYDAVLSHLVLHHINDLEQILQDIQRVLRPDGVFIGSLFGGDTLHELRIALQLAEQERRGGLAMHVAPTADGRDLSSLMQRSGMTITTVDVDEITLHYSSSLALMMDLQAMGENSCLVHRPSIIHRDCLLASMAIYEGLQGPTNPATFQIFYLIGWKSSPKQPQPIDRGSGKVSLKEIL